MSLEVAYSQTPCFLFQRSSRAGMEIKTAENLLKSIAKWWGWEIRKFLALQPRSRAPHALSRARQFSKRKRKRRLCTGYVRGFEEWFLTAVIFVATKIKIATSYYITCGVCMIDRRYLCKFSQNVIKFSVNEYLKLCLCYSCIISVE